MPKILSTWFIHAPLLCKNSCLQQKYTKIEHSIIEFLLYRAHLGDSPSSLIADVVYEYPLSEATYVQGQVPSSFIIAISLSAHYVFTFSDIILGTKSGQKLKIRLPNKIVNFPGQRKMCYNTIQISLIFSTLFTYILNRSSALSQYL